MPFPTVKSNPYKPKRAVPSRGPLWSGATWKALERGWFDPLIIRRANADLPERYRPKVVLHDGNDLTFVGHQPPP
jgi:hypothetical protein